MKLEAWQERVVYTMQKHFQAASDDLAKREARIETVLDEDVPFGLRRRARALTYRQMGEAVVEFWTFDKKLLFQEAISLDGKGGLAMRHRVERGGQCFSWGKRKRVKRETVKREKELLELLGYAARKLEGREARRLILEGAYRQGKKADMVL